MAEANLAEQELAKDGVFRISHQPTLEGVELLEQNTNLFVHVKTSSKGGFTVTLTARRDYNMEKPIWRSNFHLRFDPQVLLARKWEANWKTSELLIHDPQKSHELMIAFLISMALKPHVVRKDQSITIQLIDRNQQDVVMQMRRQARTVSFLK